VVIDKHCNKSGDGFHNWNLDIDLNKVFCVYCGEFYSSDGQTEHRHVYIQNKLVGDGRVRCLHCDKEFEAEVEADINSTKSQELFVSKVNWWKNQLNFWWGFALGFTFGVIIVGSIG